MQEEVRDERFNLALGCLMGACIGDASGAVLEKLGREPTDDEVDVINFLKSICFFFF
jgi:ADP-ribosylglycohydrolase